MNVFNPRLWYARRLAKSGALDQALFWSECRDVPILSAAGCLLRALEYAGERSPYRILPLLRCGRYEEIRSLWKDDPRSVEQARCWGKLAAVMPEEVLKVPRLSADVRCYCLMAVGRLAEAEALEVSLGMRLKLALRRKNDREATEILQGIFRENALAVPAVRFQQGRLLFPKPETGGIIQKGPLISVIMACHNEERYVETAIDSILAQRYTPLELIVVDDGSRDATADIIRGRAARDRRILPIFLTENRGLWNAKNRALERASGTYVTMQDADDWAHPDKLKILQNALKKRRGIQCVSSRLIRFCEDGSGPFSRDVDNFIRFDPSSLLFRRDFIQNHGGYLNCMGADCEMAARITLLFGAGAHCRLGLPLALGLHREDGLTSKFQGVNGGKRRLEDWETWRFDHVAYLKNHRRPGMRTPQP